MTGLDKMIVCMGLVVTAHVSLAQDSNNAVKKGIEHWFPSYEFSFNAFKHPSIAFAPFTRWWWPGNSVDKTELKREINLFADKGFGGVEIQPLYRFIPGTKQAREKEITWDTPDYYDNLIVVMQESRKRGLTVDMTDGSGWPPGGPYLNDEDGFWTLDHADTLVQGGTQLHFQLPTVKNNFKVASRLVAVLATKIRGRAKDDSTKTVPLDASSVITLTAFAKENILDWKAPDGNWQILTFWSRIMGEQAFTATPRQGPVMDHFDSGKVLKNYNHLFGARTGLQPYFGNPMRAVFDDSYEFSVDRHFSNDFIDFFKLRRGYDITPWLPAVMQKGYNFVSFSRPVTDPDFSFSDQDGRLQYDYDITLSELIESHFLDATRHWLEPKGLLHRTQAYGFNLDMIGLAGKASIPETESMLGPEASLKIMSSGGHLYNRPVISAESVVFANRAYTNTPQKIKIAADKLFAAGVNQIIYHGVPYRYTPPELGEEGWYPFSRPSSAISYSSNLGEGNVFWKYQKHINEYISRTQYALRSGKPYADVLIYFPFMDLEGMPGNPEEILTRGELPGIEGALPEVKESGIPVKEKWAKVVYPIINELEANGITWDWANDLSIQAAQLTGTKQINIRGNLYQALILAEDSVLQLKTAQKINLLASGGMHFVTAGQLPRKQPSFFNWKENDQKTEQAIATALKAINSTHIKSETELTNWIKTLRQPVGFNSTYHFTRTAKRIMRDGSRIQFIWNKSDQWQTIALSLDKTYKSSYWIDAATNVVTQNRALSIGYRLPPYGSIILFATTRQQTSHTATQATAAGNAKELLTLSKWNIKAGSVEINNSPLFDWRSDDSLKYSSAEGIYTTTFDWEHTNAQAHYYLDLGKVWFTAEVIVNGKPAGNCIFEPYVLDIGSFLIQGNNTIEVHVTTGQLNGFIYKAKQGDGHYRQFRKSEDQLMAAGLQGPVVIREN